VYRRAQEDRLGAVSEAVSPEPEPPRGTRVHLRRPVPDDEAPFCALVTRSREFLSRFAPGMPMQTDPEGRKWFARTLELNAAGPNNCKMLVCHNDDGALLGCMNLNEIVRGSFQNAFLGYWIGVDHARKGYSTEALQLALEHAFRGLGLHRVEANIQPGNAPSAALVRAAGFRLEGRSLRYLYIGTEWADHDRWALTVEEWEEQRASGE
jgi:ribosomal-protein-alanine N-acetyltransferase